MIRDLVPNTDQILKDVMEEFDFANPPIDPNQLAVDLAETMIEHKALGIASNQIGLPYRAFAINSEQIMVCFNPRIVGFSDEMVYLPEGCLSYPGISVKVKRPGKIRVRYTQANGETVTKVFEGITARVFQHELDHLDGVCHLDRATKFHIEQAKKRASKHVRR